MKITRKQLKKIVNEATRLQKKQFREQSEFEMDYDEFDSSRADPWLDDSEDLGYDLMDDDTGWEDPADLEGEEFLLHHRKNMNLSESTSRLVKDAIFSSKKGGMKVDFGSGDNEIKLVGKDGSVFVAKILKRMR
tara:strand:+ start:915 stop:1316 length:402 start_codon:yes stop_codon:yes gene_type:complete